MGKMKALETQKGLTFSYTFVNYDKTEVHYFSALQTFDSLYVFKDQT